MAEPITAFRGAYRFLSNFSGQFPDGTTVESRYQACKAIDPPYRDDLIQNGLASQVQGVARTIMELGPSDAKTAGGSVQLPDDWEESKVEIMRKLVRLKFQAPDLKAKLLATGDAELQEGNSWGDSTWGVYRGKGQNLLGKILMEIRADKDNLTPIG